MLTTFFSIFAGITPYIGYWGIVSVDFALFKEFKVKRVMNTELKMLF